MTKKIKALLEKYNILLSVLIALFVFGGMIMKPILWPVQLNSEIKLAKNERIVMQKQIEKQEACCEEIKEEMKDKVTRSDLEKSITQAIKPIDDKIENLQSWIKILYEKEMGKSPISVND